MRNECQFTVVFLLLHVVSLLLTIVTLKRLRRVINSLAFANYSFVASLLGFPLPLPHNMYTCSIATLEALELIECPQKIQHAFPFSPGVTNDHAECSMRGGNVALFLVVSFFLLFFRDFIRGCQVR